MRYNRRINRLVVRNQVFNCRFRLLFSNLYRRCLNWWNWFFFWYRHMIFTTHHIECFREKVLQKCLIYIVCLQSCHNLTDALRVFLDFKNRFQFLRFAWFHAAGQHQAQLTAAQGTVI